VDPALSVVSATVKSNDARGLAQSVDRRVESGTDLLIAAIDPVGPGEIRALTTAIRPDIAAITAIGESRRAQFRTREAIARAVSEATENVNTVVIPIDDPLLAALAMECIGTGKHVITVTTNGKRTADVVVADGRVAMRLETAEVPIPTSNALEIAVALGVVLALDISLDSVTDQLARPADAADGPLIIDDTQNSDPAGAERAIEGAAELAAQRGGDLVVVTPGISRLGAVQAERNRELAASVLSRGGYLLAIGRTNRAALVSGDTEAQHPIRSFDRAEQASAEAHDQAGDRGVILYEGELPDWYP
jgi:UDP-N-acetylmuramoyl-tripeptide--D-alanyl-D-alanine ligase